MSTIDWGAASRAELFVRSDLPTPAKQCRTSALSRVEELVDDGVLDGFSMTSWAKRVPLDEDADLGVFERARFDEFSAWAGSTGVRLAPVFDTRECHSTTTGERQTQLVLPAVCLALYDEEGLVAVVPHASESGTVRLGEALDRLDESADDDRFVALAAD